MAFDLGSAVGYLLLDTTGFESGFQKAKNQLNMFADSSLSFDKRMQGLSSGLSIIGGKLTKNITLPLIGLGTATAKAAIDFESAFTGVRKTVDATEEEYAVLMQGITDMSNRMPQSASAIAGVMEIAGQLGVRGTENLLSFTDTMIRLGDSTNMSSEEAATAIARIMNVMNTSEEDVSRFGSTIVALGNSFATTESEITEMANRMAAGGAIAGLTEPQILALAAAMSSVGINAEAGGTAMTQTFNEIEKAVVSGGEQLSTFAQVSGMSAEEFAAAWESNPIAAITSFIQGLARLEEEGGSATLILNELGLTGIRQSDMLKSLSQAGDLLNDTLATANEAWSENTALTKESETRYDTLASKLQILWNNVKNLAISFGNLLMPAIEKVSSFIQSFVEKLNSLDESQKRAIVSIAGLVAAVGPVILIISKLIGAIAGLKVAFSTLRGIFLGTISPVSLIVTVIATLVAAFIYLWNTSESFRNFWKNLWEDVKQIVSDVVIKIKEIWSGVSTFFSEVWQSFYSTLEPAISAVVNAFSSAWSLIQTIWQFAQPFFAALVQGIISVWQALVPIFQAIWEAIKTSAQVAWNIIKDVFQFAWENVKNVWNVAVSYFSTLWNTIAGIFSAVESVLTGDFEGAWIAIQEVFAGWGDFFAGLWETLVNAFSGAINLGAKIVSDIRDGFAAAWGGFVSWVTSLWEGLKSKLSLGNLLGNASGGVSGSFATGIDYVPSDRIVKVHEGEAILSKQQNREMSFGNANNATFSVPVVLDITQQIDGMTLARNQYKYNLIVSRNHGASFVKV